MLTREKGGAMILAIFLVVVISILLGRMNEWIFAGSETMMKDKSSSIAKVRSIGQLGLGVSLLKRSGVIPENWVGGDLPQSLGDCLGQFGPLSNGQLTSKDSIAGSPEFVASEFRYIDLEEDGSVIAGKVIQLNGANVAIPNSVLIVIGCGKFNREIRASYAVLARKDDAMIVIERKEA